MLCKCSVFQGLEKKLLIMSQRHAIIFRLGICFFILKQIWPFLDLWHEMAICFIFLLFFTYVLKTVKCCKIKLAVFVRKILVYWISYSVQILGLEFTLESHLRCTFVKSINTIRNFREITNSLNLLNRVPCRDFSTQSRVRTLC